VAGCRLLYRRAARGRHRRRVACTPHV
jgi:hypothetical protein